MNFLKCLKYFTKYGTTTEIDALRWASNHGEYLIDQEERREIRGKEKGRNFTFVSLHCITVYPALSPEIAEIFIMSDNDLTKFPTTESNESPEFIDIRKNWIARNVTEWETA